MTNPGARIKVVVAAGVPISEAVKATLRPLSINDFAEKHGVARTAVSTCIHGKQRHERVRVALAEELGVEKEWLDQQLDSLSAVKVA